MRHEGKSEKEAVARAGNAGGGADSIRQAKARGLSAWNERRHAAARDDRAGAGLQAEDRAALHRTVAAHNVQTATGRIARCILAEAQAVAAT